MKTTILSLVLASIAGLMYFSDESLAVAQEPEDKELQTLMETRRDTLKEVVRLVDVRFKTGTMTANKLLMAQTALLEAELELAKSQHERIAIFEKMLEAQTEVERILNEIVASGGREGAGRSELFIATADRMKAEIDLYKAKKGNWPVLANRTSETPAAVQGPSDEALQALLEARHETLRDAARFIQTNVGFGRPESDELAKANMAFLEAELELVRSPEERIAIYEKMVGNQKEIEEKLNTLVESRVGSRKEPLNATAARINAEIQLHQARKGKWPVMTESGRENPAVTQEPEDPELRALLEARRDTLKEVVSLLNGRFQTGTITAYEPLMAKTALLEAELELAKSQHERIAIFEKMLEAQTEVERNLSEIVEYGGREGAGPEDLKKATAARMKAEIDLHKARKKVK